MISFPQLCLLEYAVHGTRSQIIGKMPGNGDPAGFFRMFILAVTSFCCNQVPSISFYYLNNFPDFQDDTSSTLYQITVCLLFRFLCRDKTDLKTGRVTGDGSRNLC